MFPENSRENLRRSDPDRLRQGHLLHVLRSRSRKNGINDPHNDSANQQRQRHYPKIFQVFADDFGQGPRRNRGHDKCYDRKTQWMCEDGAIPAFSLRKGTNKPHDAVPKIHWQSENGSELDHNRVHFPEAIVQVDVQQRFTNAQMRGRAHRKKFG